jgi:HAD superfamily hydrolase (TIGR01509 family)
VQNAIPLHKMLIGKRLLIFDFDGTLVDTGPLHEAAFNTVLEPWGFKVDYPAIAGLRTVDAFLAIFAANNLSVSKLKIQELTLSKQFTVRALIERELEPMPGVDKFLRWALPRYRLALFSSGSTETVNFAIRKLNYTGWFDPLLCSEDVENAKPHPEGFLKVLSISKVSADQAIIFEDSDVGVLSARRANVSCVRVWAKTFEDFAIF